ncbi:hypothetical protein [Paenibacillus dendritiformis]|uniref:hypothetical protein n=1 Tax=Paenibacillus dendritiformis TaxID=130049 RepID=UPI000DAABECE|nr:hypothetical protein [Paenibacillus dendritiformis]PZM65687.1 hypothetical protein DOE73_10265 [Paenibacillus dendritiformis]
MSKPEFLSFGNVAGVWYVHCPGVEDAIREARMQTDLEAMERIAEFGKVIATEIGQINAQIRALNERCATLIAIYKELEKHYNEHSASYDKLLENKN